MAAGWSELEAVQGALYLAGMRAEKVLAPSQVMTERKRKAKEKAVPLES